MRALAEPDLLSSLNRQYFFFNVLSNADAHLLDDIELPDLLVGGELGEADEAVSGKREPCTVVLQS